MNTTCPSTIEDDSISEDPLWKGFTFHHFGLFLCAIFGLISVIVSLWLIMMHALHYLRPGEQKQIIRILFMIPIYSVVSFISYLKYRESVYFQVIRDCYEAFAISSFFALMCHYIAPSLHEQKEYFRSIQPKNWFWGVFGMQKCTGGENKGPFRKPRSGLTWFNVIWVGIFQYCFIRVFFTGVSVVSEAFGRYCEASLSPVFAHVWVQVFEAAAVTVAMFMVIQFYIQLKDDLAEHKPFLKVLSIKLVIFFSFWQTIVISFLSSSNGPLKPTNTLAYQDIKIGIPSVLLCIEMAFFSVLHIFAYPWKPYSIKHMSNDPLMASGMGFSGEMPKYQGGALGWRAIADAFNPWDIIKASARGFRWLFVGVRKRHLDVSYQPTKLGPDNNTSYTGPTFAGTGETATELRTTQQNRRGRAEDVRGDGAAFDDRAGLLSYSQVPARANSNSPGNSPYRTDSQDEYASGGDLGAPTTRPGGRAVSPGMDLKPSNFEDEDIGFHPGMGPATSVHPAHRPGEFGSAPGGSVGRPPTYRTNDDSYG